MSGMNKKTAIAASAGLAALLAASFFYRSNGGNAAAYISPSDQARVERGKAVYHQHCAACHGENLEGQPEWRTRLPDGRLPAPPHDKTGHTWHHPDAVLIDIVKHGLVPGKTAPEGYKSDMPGYAKSLSDEDIAAVLAYIKHSWPADVLELQKSVTLQRSQK